MRSFLITGGAGFIGSHFLLSQLKKNNSFRWVILDKLTYAASTENIEVVLKNPNFTLIKGDICNSILLNDIFKKYQIENVIHFAAESHVDNSITSPSAFINTNITGTFALLEAAKKLWLSKDFKLLPKFHNSKFIHISTDEVFGSLSEKNKKFSEQSPYAPNSPYSASKASSDHLARSYFHTYGKKHPHLWRWKKH